MNTKKNILEQDYCSDVFHGINSEIFIVDKDDAGDFRFSGNNNYHQAITGFSDKNLVGKTIFELSPAFPIEKANEINNRYKKCAETGETIVYEEIFLYNGEKNTNLVQLNPIKNNAGEIL